MLTTLWSNWNSQALMVGMHAGLVHLEQLYLKTDLQVLLKLNTLVIGPSSPIPRNLPKTNKNVCPHTQKKFLNKNQKSVNHLNVHQQTMDKQCVV